MARSTGAIVMTRARMIAVMKVCAIMIIYTCMLAAIALMLSACATKPIPIAYQCPRLTLPTDPVLELKTLTAASTPDKAVKACWADIMALRGWDSTVRQEVTSHS